jgi:NAD-dependent SIR2 family protein deacetylase
VDFNLDNLEHIFSLADMEKQIGLPDGVQHFSDLKYVIMETLDNSCKVALSKGKFIGDQHYTRFIDKLRELNKKRNIFLKQLEHQFEKDVIITFNYDVMLDHAMRYQGIVPDYCIESSEKPNYDSYKLLKLHGSINWARCRKNCGNELQVVRAYPLADGYHLLDPYIVEQYSFPMCTEVLPKTECRNDQCKSKEALEPILIPPTWSKAVEGSPISKIWASAVKEINGAFQIVVIGYSMPPTDTFFQYLMTLGLSTNQSLHRIIVVDKDDKVCNKVEEITGITPEFAGDFETFLGNF